MHYEDLVVSLRKVGKDPSKLIFEDELTGLHNRRFLFQYLHNHLAEATKEHPLSLLMVDLDNLKQINDLHGHAGGDLALILIARLLKEAAGDRGLAIRYAGDEFMLLLPDTPKTAASALGRRLLQQCRSETLQIEDTQAVLQPTMSLGLASLPEDAQTAESLIQRADMALFHAKRLGRNRMADVADLSAEEAAERTGLLSLRNATAAGRELQLAQVAEAYAEFCQGRSRFVVVEGAAGMGKSTFLEVIREALTNKAIPVVKVLGIQQETYRPYYLAGRILVNLFNQKEERGSKVYDRLTPAEAAYLDNLLPLSDRRIATDAPGDEQTLRESIFALFVNIIPKLVDFGPMVLLVDDLQLADEATLLALRCLMLRDETPLFVCGTSIATLPQGESTDLSPLERFVTAYAEEIAIRRVGLTPLGAGDIKEHLRGMFPHFQSTGDLEQNLAEATQGNPLFLGEVLRKLISDQKLSIEGQQWKAGPLEESYLPNSVEEIVRQKLSALDVEGRDLLAHASTIGDDLSMSMLTGSSEKPEAKVQEFVEQAARLGLISSEFSKDDEAIRFLSRQVLGITYGDIQPQERERLHEHIGEYQESLFRQRVLPSASYLAYHFKRSSNREKARVYEELQAKQSTKIFNAEEAVDYSGDQPGEQIPDTPLSKQSMEEVPTVLRALLTAVRNVKLYPTESKTVANSNAQLLEAVTAILRVNDNLKIVLQDDRLVVNTVPLQIGQQKALLDKFMEFLRSVELGTIAFRKSLTQRELEGFLQAFAQIKPAQTLERQFWRRFVFDQNLKQIYLTQVKYIERAARAVPQAQAASKGLGLDQIRLVRDIIHHLLSTAKNIKLYPRQSRTVTSSLERLNEGLTRFLSEQRSLTVGRTKDSLIVNGEKIDVTEFKGVADGFLEFMSAVGLKSLTLLAQVPPREVEAFFLALKEQPSGSGTAEFWKQIAKSQRLSKILFDEYDYGVESMDAAQPDAAGVEEASEEPEEQDVSFDERLQQMPGQVSDLLLRGDTTRLKEIVGRAFEGFHGLDAPSRGKVVDICRTVFDTLPFGFKPVWSNLVADPLIVICGEEKDPKVFVVLPTMLRKMAEDMIPFAEYLLAARIFSRLVGLYKDFQKDHDSRAQILGDVLERRPDGKTQKLLVQDLKSQDPARQQAVVQVLGSLGPAGMYLLIEIIKTEDDLRVRQLAARLLADLGQKAGGVIKRELALEVTAQGRCRMLEVIDTVTQSLEAELAFALGDENQQVRQAAFNLAERLRDDRTVNLLLNCAVSEDAELAAGAIRCLGKLRPAGASARLISVLQTTRDTDPALACCQALGQIGDPAGIEALARIVAAKGWFYLGRRYSAKVRGAAAFALRALPAAQVAEALTPLLHDRDFRVRRVARTYVQSP